MGRVNLFAPKTIKRFYEEGRGQGVNAEYKSWYQIGRGELSTHGLASIQQSPNGPKHTLSTVEKIAYQCSLILPGYFDTREQFPLSLDPGEHEITAYTKKYGQFFPGTRDLAIEHGIPHRKDSGPYTTDQLVAFKTTTSIELLAIACKGNAALSKRDIELLYIEKLYWNVRGVRWLLFTPELYTRAFANTLLGYYGLAALKGAEYDEKLLRRIIQRIKNHPISYAGLFQHFTRKGIQLEVFQKTFWSSFFAGSIPMEIIVSFNPHKEIRLLDRKAFLSQNPLFEGRSAWKY